MAFIRKRPVELFFRWIKQNLQLRTFYGLTRNAVRIQLWSAISAHLLVAIARKELGLSLSLRKRPARDLLSYR